MKHSYIFKEGNWKAIGIYHNYEEKKIDISGNATIKHFNDQWFLDSLIELELENPIRFFQRHTITPKDSNKNFTLWTAENSSLGKLTGKFVIFEDEILSFYNTVVGNYSGVENFHKINENKYICRGVLFNRDFKMSSWEISLKKVLPGIDD